MQNKEEIRAEIEELREKLNFKVANNEDRIPDLETIELSHRIDDLLNLLEKQNI